MSHIALSRLNQKILLTIICGLFFLSTIKAQVTGAITHQPIYQHVSTESLVINALVSSAVDVDRVVLFFRQAGEEGYIDIEMERAAEGWYGEIFPAFFSPEGIEYYISAVLVDETLLTFPEDDPEGSPLLVQIVPPSEPEIVPEPVEVTPVSEEVVVTAEQEAILVFSPLPGAKVQFDDVMVAASLFNIDSVDIATVKVYLNGRDVTAGSEISADLVLYEPLSISPGVHQIKIEVKMPDDRLLGSRTWSFETARQLVEEVERVEREFTYRGRINGGYSYDRIDESDPLAISQTTAAFSGQWRTVNFKTDMKLTTEENPFKQARNRYRFNLNVGKYLSLKLGDFNSRISRFTLDGKRVRGLDADLKLGVINLHVVKGELDRSIQGRYNADEALFLDRILVTQNPVDSTKHDFTYRLSRKGYAFRKDVFAARLSFGNAKSAQIGFNLLKAKDDINSVDRTINDAKISIDQDSSGVFPLAIGMGTYTYSQLDNAINSAASEGYGLDLLDRSSWSGETPQDNVVIGSDIKLSLFKRKFNMEGGWAFSMLNRDIWEGAISLAEMDTLIDEDIDNSIAGELDLGQLPDPAEFENIFVINQNMIPLIPVDPTIVEMEPIKAVLSMPSLSYNFKTTANILSNRVTLEYVKVGPEFNSLGNPYIQKNIRQYTASDRIGLFRNRLLLNLMYKHQDDDILRTVTHVTTTNTLTANVGIYPGAGLPSIVVSYRNQDRDNGKENLDTVRTDLEANIIELEDFRDWTNTKNISVGISHRIDVSGLNNSIAVTYIILDREDQFEDRPFWPYYSINQSGDTLFVDSSFASPNLASDVINISLITDYPFPLKTTAVLSINNSTFGKKGDGDIYYYGDQGITNVTLNGTYDMLKGRLKLLAGIDYTLGSGNEEFSRMGLRGGFNYRITDVLRFRFDGGVRSKSINDESKNSTLLRATLNYTF